MQPRKNPEDKKNTLIQAATTPAFAALVKSAADRDYMSISEYVRRAVVDRLRWQGVDPTALSRETGR